eukprot:TRINITY_DN4438_c0_g1_i3.p1 TRINITY_DN4438_c0_g1~~TRINITY_DN4438_c0_g1_i3.p1  ORF type:complete len:200 (-),score=53.88 TRINITY_DN4438_c0_g1_i3:197-796(-)
MFNAAARQFAHPPEGFDPQKAPSWEQGASSALKEILAENRKRAEDEWAEEHKFQPPKAMDEDEEAFLKKHEEQRRLRFLEREIADLHEIEQFENDVREKVYTVQAPAILETSVIPQPKTEKKSAIGVKIVKRSKTDASKTDSKKESNDIHGKKVSKQDQTSTPKKNRDSISNQKPISNTKEDTTPSIKTSHHKFSGLWR